MTADLTLTFESKDAQTIVAARKMVRDRLPWGMRHALWLGIVYLTGIVAISVFLTRTVGPHNIFSQNAGLFTYAGLAVLFASSLFSRRRLYAGFRDAARRAGNVRVTLTNDGIEVRDALQSHTVLWPGVDKLVAFKGGLIVYTHCMVAQHIPATAFADGAAKVSFTEAVTAQIARSRAA